jgi:formate dehydrogenase major subunit
VEFRASLETTNDEFPLLLTTGRTFYQFNAGTMTMRTPNALLRGNDTLDMSPDDASRLGVVSGQLVQLSSRHGTARLPARVDPRVRKGEVFATFHTVETFLNNVTGADRDRIVLTPEYKVVAVAIEKV